MVDLATDIAAEPTALPITNPFSTDSTAFCVTAFGINVNIDIAVFESTHQSGREFLPFAAWMYAYRLYAESEQPTIVTNSQIKRNPKTQKTTNRSLKSIRFEQKLPNNRIQHLERPENTTICLRHFFGMLL